jgi:hypothetical protein
VEDKLKLIGQQLNEVLAWMQSRLQGEQDYQTMLRDVVEQSQTHINLVVEKKRADDLAAKLKREAAEEEARIKNLEK